MGARHFGIVSGSRYFVAYSHFFFNTDFHSSHTLMKRFSPLCTKFSSGESGKVEWSTHIRAKRMMPVSCENASHVQRSLYPMMRLVSRGIFPDNTCIFTVLPENDDRTRKMSDPEKKAS
jgi:hypothetical protein